MMVKSHFGRKSVMVKLFPGPHVYVGLILVGRAKWGQQEIENQENKADGGPGDDQGADRRCLHFRIGVHKILQQGNQFGGHNHRVKAGQNERKPESNEHWEKTKRPENPPYQINQYLAPETLLDFWYLADMFKIPAAFCPVGSNFRGFDGSGIRYYVR